MLTKKFIGVVGSREFRGWDQLQHQIDMIIAEDDEIVSGGAVGADSMAQRYCKQYGYDMQIKYPKWRRNGEYDAGAGFKRNKTIVEQSDIVLAFYQKGRFQQGGTANTAKWARELERPLFEFEEE